MKAGFQKEGKSKISHFLIVSPKVKNAKVGLSHSTVLRPLPLSGLLNSVFATQFVHPDFGYAETSYMLETLADIRPLSFRNKEKR